MSDTTNDAPQIDLESGAPPAPARASDARGKYEDIFDAARKAPDWISVTFAGWEIERLRTFAQNVRSGGYKGAAKGEFETATRAGHDKIWLRTTVVDAEIIEEDDDDGVPF